MATIQFITHLEVSLAALTRRHAVHAVGNPMILIRTAGSVFCSAAERHGTDRRHFRLTSRWSRRSARMTAQQQATCPSREFEMVANPVLSSTEESIRVGSGNRCAAQDRGGSRSGN